MSEGDEQAGQEGGPIDTARHFMCPKCQEIIHDPTTVRWPGDICPKCFGGQVIEVFPAPQFPSVEQLQKPMIDLMDRTERERAERTRKQHEEAILVAMRTASAMESIAQSLATLASVVTHDDLGNAAFRIVGDLIGGEGDIPVE